MGRTLPFAVVLVAGLGLLTLGATALVQRTTGAWFEKDVLLRAELAVSGSRRALLPLLKRSDWVSLRELLEDLTRDERILAAAACTADHRLVAATAEVFEWVDCAGLERWLADSPRSDGAPRPRHTERDLPSGRVHASALPVWDAKTALVGHVLLLHDLSWLERRESSVRTFLLLAFVVLAVGAVVLTGVASKLSWQGWSNTFRRLLRGEELRPEFRPLMQDVRSLVQSLAEERAHEEGHGPWTPQRLKQTLRRHLGDERVVLVANREPYIHEHRPEGVTVLHPASGLVTALEPVMRTCSGTWIAHGSGSADRERVDGDDRVRVPPGEESYWLRRVWLSKEEERGYYDGLSNEGLWPLCHMAHTRPTFRSEDWAHYRAVNQKFADTVCAEVDSEDPIVLVQDYHLALVPRLIRERLPRATILSFWHIPWPNAERFGICPWAQALLEGLLGSSIVGFHTQLHCNNFFEAVDRYLEARIDRERSAVVQQGRGSLVRAYPISVEWPNRWIQDSPPPDECRRSVFADLGLPADALLGVGVDRLDYTKGVEERLLAVERLLERFPEYRGRFSFAQLAAPSRTTIESYQRLNDNVLALAERINRRFGTDSYRPILLHRAHHEPPAVMRYLRAADVCYVSSLHDGMNLVAKEFVAAREDERGVLVLSRFTGAARELTEALVVNPYDIEEASSALARALRMPLSEQRGRMHALRALVQEFNVYRWAGRMLVDAAHLRSRERLQGQFELGVLKRDGTTC